MTEQRDYRDTVFLPKTDFPMKAGLPQKEPGILARWQAEGLYEQLRAARAGREKFILHDGPPYANGDIHVGHALNHILKDMVVRTQSLLGKDAPYVPGWDCHGLPIEWKVEEQYRKKKLDKDQVEAAEFRAECRAYAQGWVDRQREQLKRLGVNADWDHPYLTMDPQAEGTIVAELMKFAESGQLYRGSKPVMWSPVEKTALAEAEVEYEDIVSTQVDVAFEIVESPIAELVGAYAVIWTTTPWTIPVNQALAYGAEVEYTLVGFGFSESPVPAMNVAESMRDHPELRHLINAKYIVARNLVSSLRDRIGAAAKRLFPDRDFSVQVNTAPTLWLGVGSDLAGTLARHPMAKLFESPLPFRGGAGGGASPPDATLREEDRPHPNPSPEGEGLKIDPTSPLAEFFLRPRPFLDGSAFVTTETGTGLVHMAPDHGEDDFLLCKAQVPPIDPVFAVEADGKYRADWAWLGGQGPVVPYSPKGLDKLNFPEGPICSALREADALLSASPYPHSYPHSWRSKAKVIYRCTPQWFVPMDSPVMLPHAKSRAEKNWENEGGAPLHDSASLRQIAMAAIAATRWVPEKGRNRISSMVEGRPDWVLSRQRAWGVPITLFVKLGTNQYLDDPAVNARIVAAVKADGVDAWSDARAQEYLGSDYRADDYERVTDILDVWFDSGCTHAFVLESGRWPHLMRPEGYCGPPADLYLEGSDQHRGWFQSSLLESCATRGHAPYKAVLTHGFTMDSKGMKMSKSLGNTIDPIKVMEVSGADIIRLWALSVDYTEDHRIGDEILKGVADQYRKLRNTFRYLLGALEGYQGLSPLGDCRSFPAEAAAEKVGTVPKRGQSLEELPELERYMLALLAKLDATLRQAVADFDFNTYVRALTDFCNEDLSAFFFDIRKDCLYCDAADDPKRMAYRTVLDTLFHALVRYAAPVLVFTAEEVWGTRFPDAGSVHLLEWPTLLDTTTPRHPGESRVPASSSDTGQGSGTPDQVRCDELVEKWATIRKIRSKVNERLESHRRNKIIGSSLEAMPTIIVGEADYAVLAEDESILVEALIVSGVTLIGSTESDEVMVQEMVVKYHKCGRCWKHLPEVSEDGGLCSRCDHVVAGIDAAV